MSNDVSWNLASIMLIRSLDYGTFTYRWGGVRWSGGGEALRNKSTLLCM